MCGVTSVINSMSLFLQKLSIPPPMYRETRLHHTWKTTL
jgi:hypothetical protein